MSATASPASDLAAHEKELRLRSLMREMKSVLVAYSGGVDSTYLAAIANDELGQNALSILGLSPSVSDFQRKQAHEAATQLGLNFQSIDTDELSDERYAANPTNRCYFCKSELFSKLTSIASRENFSYILDGTNFDDLVGHRPGKIAATENGVRSPLAELGFTKDNIRERSWRFGIEDWDKPASPCLASRIAYGVPVTRERLSMVERGEDVIRELGFSEFRVRTYGDSACVEIGKEKLNDPRTQKAWPEIARKLRLIGFQKVTLDGRGFRSGSMNEEIV